MWFVTSIIPGFPGANPLCHGFRRTVTVLVLSVSPQSIRQPNQGKETGHENFVWSCFCIRLRGLPGFRRRPHAFVLSGRHGHRGRNPDVRILRRPDNEASRERPGGRQAVFERRCTVIRIGRGCVADERMRSRRLERRDRRRRPLGAIRCGKQCRYVRRRRRRDTTPMAK